MSNIELTLEVINSKFNLINNINKLLTYIIIPIIHKKNGTLYEDCPIFLSKYNIDSIIDSIDDTKKNATMISFYKNTKLLFKKLDVYNELFNQYNSNIVYYITNYYTLKNKQLELNKISVNDNKYTKDIVCLYDNLNIFISSNNFHNKLDNYFKMMVEYVGIYLNEKFIPKESIKTINLIKNELQYDDLTISNFIHVINGLSTLKKIVNNIKEMILEFNKIYNKEEICKNKYDYCSICDVKMIVKINTSELTCPSCGDITTLIGTVFEDSQFYSQEGQRFKHGSYNPMRHCKSWIESIQAKDKGNIDEDVIQKIKDKIKKNRIINVNNITIDQYRKYLKELKLTSYNNNITLIRKQITGISPPQLTHDETTMLYNYFDKSIKTYNMIKSQEKRNSLFFPYFIFKCLELIIKDSNKKKELLNCIHLQEKNTLIDNDKYWLKICEINNFKFITTDRSKYL